jgi:hypothetical protein
MMFYSTITEAGRTVFELFAKIRRDKRLFSADQVDLTAVYLFVALGLLLTAAYFTAGFGAEFGQILAISG